MTQASSAQLHLSLAQASLSNRTQNGLINGVRHSLALLAIAASLVVGVTRSATAAETQADSTPLSDGVYAYGESNEAGQIGATYMVVEVQGGHAVGGFYQPSSSFDCFQGQVVGNELELVVTNSYEQTTHPYSLALESRGAVATQNSSVEQLVPSGFYRMGALSETDRSVLQTCQAQF